MAETTATRYALEHTVTKARFCPEVGTLVGFPDALTAMRHIFEVLPNEAHAWRWVPIDQSVTEEKARA